LCLNRLPYSPQQMEHLSPATHKRGCCTVLQSEDIIGRQVPSRRPGPGRPLPAWSSLCRVPESDLPTQQRWALSTFGNDYRSKALNA
ncbi:unnamed protein product, partial [Lampetra planeri]